MGLVKTVLQRKSTSCLVFIKNMRSHAGRTMVEVSTSKTRKSHITFFAHTSCLINEIAISAFSANVFLSVVNVVFRSRFAVFNVHFTFVFVVTWEVASLTFCASVAG